MKSHLKPFIIIILLYFPMLVCAQQSEGYTITGRIAGLKDGDKIIMTMMVYNPGHADEVARDSALVKNGQFHITGVVPEGPRVYWLRIAGTESYYRMFIDNRQDIVLTLAQNVRNNKEINNTMLDKFITCSGSPTNYAFHLIWAMDEGLDVAQGGINHILNKVRDSLGYNKEIVEALMAAKKTNRHAFNAINLNNLAPDVLPGATMLVLYEGNDHDPIWDRFYDQLDDHLRNSLLGKKLKERLPLLAGKELPSFILPGPDHKPVSLKSFVTQNKVTLVHFWATNSAQRQAYDKDLRAMYKLYHDKGLNIIGVSTESYEEQWKETLGKENYPWLNVFDKKGQHVVDPVYHELGEIDHQNTTNVLLDAKGKIIAWDPAGIELQYYISKALGE